MSEVESEGQVGLEPELETEAEEPLPWAPAVQDQPEQPDESKLPEYSNVACPFCAYLPQTGRGALYHLIGHVLGTYTSGEEQLEAMQDG